MSKSVRLSDELTEKAKRAAKIWHRTPPQQIEHWAHLGMVMESAVSYQTQAKAKKKVTREEINAALSLPGTEEGRRRAHEVIDRTSSKIVSTD